MNKKQTDTHLYLFFTIMGNILNNLFGICNTYFPFAYRFQEEFCEMDERFGNAPFFLIFSSL